MKLIVICCLIFLPASTATYSLRVPVRSSPTERSVNTIPSPESGAASPEMSRLAQALAGDWDTVETMECSGLFPHGGSRQGFVRARLVAGGTSLLYEVHSDGSAGKLDGFLLIWWDNKTKLYQLFACFNDPNRPCRARGTGTWEGATFVNDYEERINGRRTNWRDSFVITPKSHTLIAAMKVGDRTTKTLITTRATRRQ